MSQIIASMAHKRDVPHLTRTRPENPRSLADIVAIDRAVEVLALAHAIRVFEQIEKSTAAFMPALTQMQVAALKRAAEIVRARMKP